MREFFSSVQFKIILAIIALLLGITIFAATTADGRSFVSSVLGGVISPFQKLSTSISEGISSNLDKLLNADKYYEENIELQKEIDELQKQIADYDAMKDENEHYKEILDLTKENPDFKFSPPCQVIGWVTNDPYKSFFIDKGSLDGISLNDPVVTDAGLVGIVDSVELTYSRVTTVLSSEYPIGVFETKTKDTGIVEGNFELAENNETLMSFINKASEMQVGAIIVTSGHSGLVPPNEVIGTVKEIRIAENNLSLEAVIEPVADFNDLKNVFVITEFEGQGEGYEQ